MAARSALGAKGTALLLSLCLTAGFSAPALAETVARVGPADTGWTIAQFPFNDQQPLTPEQVKIQKYKLERLRVNTLRDDWYVVRGINERLDDVTLLKLTGRTTQVEDQNFKQTVGNGIALGGLVVMGAGGLLMTDIFKFSNSFLVGIGLLVLGGAAALGGELWAGNIGEENAGHILERPEAEALVKEYNEKLKKELGIEHVPGLE